MDKERPVREWERKLDYYRNKLSIIPPGRRIMLAISDTCSIFYVNLAESKLFKIFGMKIPSDS